MLLVVIAAVTLTSFSHLTCDGTSTNKNIGSVISDHVQRLMELRHSDWGWHNTPEVVLSLQLTKQEAFFGRDHTWRAMKEEFSEERNTVSLGKLALYSMATQALSKNPRNFAGNNLPEMISQRLDQTLRSDNQKYWYSEALALQALCLSDININDTVLANVLNSQSESGAYGSHSPVDTTAQMLIALKCVGTQDENRPRNVKKELKRVIKLGARFLRLQIDHFLDSWWIGNKYSTPIALSALKAVNRSFHERKESKLYRSLKSCDLDEVSEAAVAQRMLALKNVTVLNLKGNWLFSSETAPTPNGCSPTSSEQSSFSCSTPILDEDDPSIILIDVRISYSAGERSKMWMVNDVTKDYTLLQVMQKAKCDSDFDFEIKQTSWGPAVLSINGEVADSSINQYWSLRNAITNEFLPTGVGQYRPSDEEHILFKLCSY